MVVLKNIPPILSPELIYALAQMGHGDEIVLADANFPSSSVCKCGPTLIRADGHNIPELLEAILTLLPLDTYEIQPAFVMDVVPSDAVKFNPYPPIWNDYETILNRAEHRKIGIGKVPRFDFYDRSKKAFAVVATGEKALYGNLILKKGVISES
ncbi:fucose mutarotase-like [Anneissia japonica]|uniref:fucose mutarotase-like n=1 Tax=Anneissia japonica TaxID=1529436 RepID=UPI00142583F3|nr:fucose mutarotase-like [Anneissia japonica]